MGEEMHLAILDSLVQPVLVLDADNQISYANAAAEQFFQSSSALLQRQKLEDIAPFGSPLLGLVSQVREAGHTTSEYGVDLGTPKSGPRLANITVSPVMEAPDKVVISLQEATIASKMDKQLTHRSAARSVSAMAAMLAHEVKNPLSGIRGAAQLLELSAEEDDRALTQLICDETDRIVAIVERMDMFSDVPIEREPINIHKVLERVRRVAENGFARDIRFVEDYDPSLPPVWGDFDQLVQVFLNLVKNAAEAMRQSGSEIVIRTAFRHGVRLEVPGSKTKVKLPLEVCIQDNGPGIPEDIQPYIFDAFLSTKPRGSGLGLALVAKLIGDHGGVVECDSEPGKTLFRVLLPIEGMGGD